jgi:hypothetical protein
VQTTIILKPRLQVPAIWAQLLELDFEMEGDVAKKPIMRDTVLNDPTPYRDDHRETAITDQGFTVSLVLLSGSYNYYLFYSVDCPDGTHWDSVAFHDLPDEQDEVEAIGRESFPLYFHIDWTGGR